MATKTIFSPQVFQNILTGYDLGAFYRADPISEGTVQTNYIIQTAQGKFVFRYYENRPKDSVLFEIDVLTHLMQYQFPCPYPIKNKQNQYMAEYEDKPYVLFTYVEGQAPEQLNTSQQNQLIEVVAELHKLTLDFRSPHTQHRWNYTPDLCQLLAQKEAEKIDTPDAYNKFAWLKDTLTTLQLPPSLPKGVCHSDLDVSNLFFSGDQLVALLDFDDANYTYLLFDLVCLIEAFAWHHAAEHLDLTKARAVIQNYQQYRVLSDLEQQHLIDVYKLGILIDCVWFFARGSADDFYEKRKINVLNQLGRDQFVTELFLK